MTLWLIKSKAGNVWIMPECATDPDEVRNIAAAKLQSDLRQISEATPLKTNTPGIWLLDFNIEEPEITIELGSTVLI